MQRIMSVPPVVYFPKNTTGRDFVIGDIHGCYSAVRSLLNHVNFRPSADRVFSVGDLIDRGPHSVEVLELTKQSWFFACRGNHEQMLIDHLRNPDVVPANDPVWLKKAFHTFTQRQQFSGVWLPVLESLPYVMVVGDGPSKFYVVHAEILEQRASVTEEMIEKWLFKDPEKAKKRAIWGRSLWTAFEEDRPVLRAHVSHLPLIYCGHTIINTPLQLARQIYLDGGAYVAHDNVKQKELQGVLQPHLRLVEPATKKCWSIDTMSGTVTHTPIWAPSTH